MIAECRACAGGGSLGHSHQIGVFEDQRRHGGQTTLGPVILRNRGVCSRQKRHPVKKFEDLREAGA